MKKYFFQNNVSTVRNINYLYLRHFQTIFLEEADKFIAGLDPKEARKIFYNIDLLIALAKKYDVFTSEDEENRIEEIDANITPEIVLSETFIQ